MSVRTDCGGSAALIGAGTSMLPLVVLQYNPLVYFYKIESIRNVINNFSYWFWFLCLLIIFLIIFCFMFIFASKFGLETFSKRIFFLVLFDIWGGSWLRAVQVIVGKSDKFNIFNISDFIIIFFIAFLSAHASQKFKEKLIVKYILIPLVSAVMLLLFFLLKSSIVARSFWFQLGSACAGYVVGIASIVCTDFICGDFNKRNVKELD